MSNLSIKKIKVSELSNFINSTAYKKSATKPISLLRAISYLNNPRANPDDVVIYLLFNENCLVGFRTLLPDFIFSDNKKVKFAWFSGNWVHPNYRRKGFSSKLLNEALYDWGELFMFTNYAPASKKVYDKTEKFLPHIKKPGVRLYFKFNFYELLSSRLRFVYNNKRFFKLIDAVLNGLAWPYKQLLTFISVCPPNVIIHENLNEKLLAFMDGKKDSIFKRDAETYSWVFNYPWVKPQSGAINYPFTHSAHKFYYRFLSINHNGSIVGMAVIKNRDNHLTVPYFSCAPIKGGDLLSAILYQCRQEQCTHLTVFHPQLVNKIKQTRLLGLFRKKMEQNFFITKTLRDKVKNNAKPTQDGDGDCFFT